MEILGAVTSGILSCACPPLCSFAGEQYDFVKNLEVNEETLESEVEYLKFQEHDIKVKLTRGKVQQGKIPRDEVVRWQDDVARIVSEVDKMKNKFGGGRCLKGHFPNYNSRLKLGKNIIKMIHKARELREACRLFGDLFACSLPEPADLPTSILVGETSIKTKAEILQSILEVGISKIGVYGMGGVGKTTIMKHIYNQLKRISEFDIVMWVTVSRSLTIEKLQNEIAACLGCDISGSADSLSRSLEIHEALLRRRKFVLILDDMWERFSLEEVGIPEPNKENGSKMVLTTRSKRVCGHMECERKIEVKVLSDEESWSLFESKVGRGLVSPEIKPISEQVAAECGGLPLAIITVGRAMSNADDIKLWRYALEQLKSSKFEDMNDEVFTPLKFSYDRLRNDKVQACFLYCALYPEDHDIDVKGITEYWIGEGLLDDVGDWSKEMDQGYAIVKELKDACMLENGKVDQERVKMHDLIRDLAIKITREHNLFLVRAGLGLKEPPKEREWVQCVERISLMKNNISAFPEQLNCPKLLTLLLQQNPISENLSHAFFKHMQEIRVLDISHTKIEWLPDSLSGLVNLHSLLLGGCRRLRKLPSFAKLKNLRVLNLVHTSIEELPCGFEELVTLRWLDLSYTRCLNSFPSRVLPSHLECLLMRESGWKWSSVSGDTEGKATVWELLNLRNLTRLGAEFADVQSFVNFIKSEKWQLFEYFDFSIGSLPISEGSHNIQLEGCELLREGSPILLPGNTLSLNIVDCNDITFLSEMSGSRRSLLKNCIITRCNGLEWIEMNGEAFFPRLESVKLQYLTSFKGLCKGPMNKALFTNLRILDVDKCDQLKSLIPIDYLMSNFQNLEEISVYKCKAMEEIVAGEANGPVTLTAPRLKILNLRHLPSLSSICKGRLVFSSLYSIQIHDCKKMKKLLISRHDLPPALKEIKGARDWWNALDWDDQDAKACLEPYFTED